MIPRTTPRTLPRMNRPSRTIASLLLAAVLGAGLLAAAPAKVHAYDGAWQQVATTGTLPSARRDIAAIFDASRDRVVVLAGDGRTWTRDLGASSWTLLTTAIYGPSPGFERAVYDAANDRMVMIDSNLQVSTLSLANPTAWNFQVVGGTQPTARTFFAVTYDALRGRLILYGGGPYSGVFNDLWALSLQGPMQWTRIQPTGTPPPGSWGPLAAYDATRDQVLVGFGSTTSGYDVQNRMWRVSLSGTPAWVELNPTGTLPSPRMVSTAVFDPGDDAMVIFGGYPGGGSDTWELKLAGATSWVGLTPSGSPPPSRFSAVALYRGGTNPSMLLYGGFNGTSALSDLWELGRLVPGTVEGPALQTFSPAGGVVGDAVTLSGARLSDVTSISFNGTPAPVEQAEYGSVLTHVPAGATSGPITVTSPAGSSTSAQSFFVGEVPLVQSATPDSGRSGETIVIGGAHFTGATTVKIGASRALSFTVQSDAALTVVLDSTVTLGTVSVSTPAATGASAFTVRRVADIPSPLLHFVRDVRGDQGGKVQLSWQASDYDRPARHTVTGYRVWRRGQTPLALADRPSAASPALAPPTEYWEAIATLPAAMLNGYAYTAVTASDSVEGDHAWTAFFVQALTADPIVFYNSVVDSGYSVDNLAPPTPAPFTVVYSAGANTLHWRGRTLADLRGYELHRGASATFVPSATTRIALVADTTWQDIAGPHFYKLAAVDVHGNRSLYAAVSPQSPVATLASFVRADRTAGRVTLTWYSNGNAGLEATVYRRTLASGWEVAGLAIADGDGYLRFEDTGASDDERYGYRLGITEPEVGEMLLGETWVDALQSSFALLGIAPNPSRDGRVTLSFSLPASRGARVQLFDVAGREVASADLSGTSASTSRVEFGAGMRLKAGVYLLRATSGDVRLTRRVVVLN